MTTMAMGRVVSDPGPRARAGGTAAAIVASAIGETLSLCRCSARQAPGSPEPGRVAGARRWRLVRTGRSSSRSAVQFPAVLETRTGARSRLNDCMERQGDGSNAAGV